MSRSIVQSQAVRIFVTAATAAALIAGALIIVPQFGMQAAGPFPTARSISPAACAERGWPYAWCTDSRFSGIRLVTTDRLR